MRVLHVFDHSPPIQSEYARRSIQIIKEQRRQGIETFQLTGQNHDMPFQATETIDDVEFHRSGKTYNPFGKLPLLQQKFAVRKLQKKIEEIVLNEKIDVIHAHSSSSNGLAALKVGQKHNIPVHYEVRSFLEDENVSQGIWQEGGRPYLKAQKHEEYVLEHVSSITTVSKGLKDDLIKRGIGSNKITVIPNFLDLDDYQGPFEASLEIKERMSMKDMTVLGYVGSLDKFEGLDVLIRSMRSVILSMPNTCLLLVGSGPMESELQHLAERMVLGGKVIFTGDVPQNKVSDYYKLIDIMVFGRKSGRFAELVPSLNLLEAMAMHKTVIASNVGGYKESIDDGKTGLLYKAGDAIALAEKVGDFVNNKENYIEEALNFLKEERNMEKIVKRYKDIYQNEF